MDALREEFEKRVYETPEAKQWLDEQDREMCRILFHECAGKNWSEIEQIHQDKDERYLDQLKDKYIFIKRDKPSEQDYVKRLMKGLKRFSLIEHNLIERKFN